MNKIILTAILAVCATGSAAISYSLIREHKITHMHCTTYNTIVIGSQVSSLRFDFSADGKNGSTNIDGYYMNEQGTRIPVRVSHSFNMQHSGGIYTFSHLSLGTLSGNEATPEQIKRVLPAYMTEPNAAIKLKRYQQGKNGYILSSGSVIIYCKKPSENQ